MRKQLIEGTDLNILLLFRMGFLSQLTKAGRCFDQPNKYDTTLSILRKWNAWTFALRDYFNGAAGAIALIFLDP